MLEPSLQLVVVLLVLITAPSPICAWSAIKLRGSNLTISNETPYHASPQVEAMYQEFRDHVNQQLLEGTNPFNSSSTVEANSSLILINSSSTYEALDAVLAGNSTLWVKGPDGSLALSNSSIHTAESNWLLQTNGSSLSLNSSILTMSALPMSSLDNHWSNLSSWWSDRSYVSADYSSFSVTDVRMLFNATTVSMRDATWNISMSEYTPEGAFQGPEALLAVLFTYSNIDLAQTSWIMKDIPFAILDALALSLTNATITLYNTTAFMYASSLIFTNSEILLYNSTLHLLDNTSTVAAQPLNAIKLYTNDTQTYTPTLEVYQGQNLNATTNATNDTASFNWTTALGIPFGFVNFELRNADADFEFLDQQDAAAAAPTQPGGVVTGR